MHAHSATHSTEQPAGSTSWNSRIRAPVRIVAIWKSVACGPAEDHSDSMSCGRCARIARGKRLLIATPMQACDLLRNGVLELVDQPPAGQPAPNVVPQPLPLVMQGLPSQTTAWRPALSTTAVECEGAGITGHGATDATVQARPAIGRACLTQPGEGATERGGITTCCSKYSLSLKHGSRQAYCSSTLRLERAV